MDEERLDRLTRGLDASISRRGLGGVAAVALAAFRLAAEADAKKKKKKKKPVCTPRSQAVTCAGGACGNVNNNCEQQVDCGACTGYVLDKKIGGYGSGEGYFVDLSGIAVDRDDNLYVADTNNDRIQKLSNTGQYLDHHGGSALGLNHPEGVAVDSEGNVYIADTANARVVKLNSDGGFVTEWNSAATAEDEFYLPQGIAVDPSNNVWLSDGGNQRVVKFTSAGGFLEQIGELGSPLLYFPEGLASNGTLFVADTGNDRIQRFPGTSIGSDGTGNGQFKSPRGVALDGDGNIYVADTGNARFQKFDGSGAFVVAVDESAAADGNFGYIAGIAFDSAGNVFVLDETRNCIHKFRPAGAASRVGVEVKSRGTSKKRGRQGRGKGQQRR